MKDAGLEKQENSGECSKRIGEGKSEEEGAGEGACGRHRCKERVSGSADVRE